MKRWIAGGANMSESEPVNSRAIVEVRAMVVTCVEGRPAGGEFPERSEGGVDVWMTVPSYEGEGEGVSKPAFCQYAQPERTRNDNLHCLYRPLQGP